MFEFHGWAVIGHSGPLLKHRLASLRDQLVRVDDGFGSIAELCTTSNELNVVYVHGLRNHRIESPSQLFAWLAEHVPDAYGLLYLRDDESSTAHTQNCFRVIKLARGQLSELPDPFLSPCIPTIEPEYKHSGD